MVYKKIVFVILAIQLGFTSKGQILNGYAKVSAINSKTLTVINVNETSHTFTVGGDIILMQIQDDCIGTNTTNVSTFGNVGSIANTGNYEIRKIAARFPATGTPTTIVLDFAPTYTFNTGGNSSVQIITFRNLGVNYTTTANIIGLAWDGNVGGVIAVQITNTLTLNHNISADGIGFRGGVRSSDNGGLICTSGNESVFISNLASFASKGEGIYKNTNSNFTSNRGKIINGGGGGGDHNAGGGGGGNYTSGGQGGNGYNNCTVYPAGGLPGLPLNTYISPSRIFMGGGGGGGQQNNSVGSSGGAGGGIVLIKATTLLTNTLCTSPIKISANGQTAANTGNDGAGGGGAAGTIILQINSFSISSSCTLAVNANAGSGGNCGDGQAHAGGGGGGQGAIIYSISQPTNNVTSTTTNGLPGADNSGGSISGTSGGGTNNSGVISSSVTPLPIELITFTGICNHKENYYKLKWQTLTETNNNYFIIEKSTDALNWQQIGIVNGNGNSSSIKSYSYIDYKLDSFMSYYILKQIDFDGYVNTSAVILYNEDCFTSNEEFFFFPNPANNSITINGYEKYTNYSIYNALGQIIQQNIINTSVISIDAISSGIYYFEVTRKNGSHAISKMVVGKNSN